MTGCRTIAIAAVVCCFFALAHARVLCVGVQSSAICDADFLTIQSAIDAAGSIATDSVLVGPGVYAESLLVLRPVNISSTITHGPRTPTIRAPSGGTVVSNGASHCCELTLHGFVLVGAAAVQLRECRGPVRVWLDELVVSACHDQPANLGCISVNATKADPGASVEVSLTQVMAPRSATAFTLLAAPGSGAQLWFNTVVVRNGRLSKAEQLANRVLALSAQGFDRVDLSDSSCYNGTGTAFNVASPTPSALLTGSQFAVTDSSSLQGPHVKISMAAAALDRCDLRNNEGRVTGISFHGANLTMRAANFVNLRGDDVGALSVSCVRGGSALTVSVINSVLEEVHGPTANVMALSCLTAMPITIDMKGTSVTNGGGSGGGGPVIVDTVAFDVGVATDPGTVLTMRNMILVRIRLPCPPVLGSPPLCV